MLSALKFQAATKSVQTPANFETWGSHLTDTNLTLFYKILVMNLMVNVRFTFPVLFLDSNPGLLKSGLKSFKEAAHLLFENSPNIHFFQIELATSSNKKAKIGESQGQNIYCELNVFII